MTGTLANDLTQHIRAVDGDNRAHPADLGADIARFLMPRFPLDVVLARTEEVQAFVFHNNRDKQLSAGRLAELVVDRFDLDKEA